MYRGCITWGGAADVAARARCGMTLRIGRRHAKGGSWYFRFQNVREELKKQGFERPYTAHRSPPSRG
jgi:hypothetical protein